MAPYSEFCRAAFDLESALCSGVGVDVYNCGLRERRARSTSPGDVARECGDQLLLRNRLRLVPILPDAGVLIILSRAFEAPRSPVRSNAKRGQGAFP
jgi:hypothetical protein